MMLNRVDFIEQFRGHFADDGKAWECFEELRQMYQLKLLSIFGELRDMQKTLGAWPVIIDHHTLEQIQGPNGRMGYMIPDGFDREQFCKFMGKLLQELLETIGFLDIKKQRPKRPIGETLLKGKNHVS